MALGKLASVHICPKCGHIMNLAEIDFHAITTGIVSCPRCDLRQRSTYLRSNEDMALLDITRATVCSWINSGQLKAYRLGKTNSVDPADLVSFFEAVDA